MKMVLERLISMSSLIGMSKIRAVAKGTNRTVQPSHGSEHDHIWL